MAKQTKADLENKIKELEQTIKQCQQINDFALTEATKLRKINAELRESVDSESKRELEIAWKQLQNKDLMIKEQQTIIDSLNKKNEKLIKNNSKLERKIEEISQLKRQEGHNKGFAGRKTKINDEIVNRIINLRELGFSYRDIAKQTNISHMLVSKVLKNQVKD